MDPSSRYIYGRHPVLEMLAASPQDIRAVYLQASFQGPGASRNDPLAQAEQLAREHNIPVHRLQRHGFERMLGQHAVHQGIALEAAPFAYVELEDLPVPAHGPPLYVLLDQLQDPHNVGAIARSALALGAHGLILGKDRSAMVTPTVIKAAAGATAHLPIARVTNISRALTALKKRGLWIVGTHVQEGAQPLEKVDFCLPTVLVIGSEGAGMRALTAKQCDVLTHIPISTIGSLNASVAAAICLYEAHRQRIAQLGALP